MNAIGTTSGDFLEGLILQLVNASKEKIPSLRPMSHDMLELTRRRYSDLAKAT
jgi:hypothetical protein